MYAKTLPPMNTPLSDHAKKLVRSMLEKALPVKEVNAGVRDKLHREGLIHYCERRSPYAVHRGGTCQHIALTEKGTTLARTL